MAIHFACMCGRTFSVRATHAGETLRCPDCGDQLTVPAASTIRQPAPSDPGAPPITHPTVQTTGDPADAAPVAPEFTSRTAGTRRRWWFPSFRTRLVVLGLVLAGLIWTWALRSPRRDLAIEANGRGVAFEEANHLYDAEKEFRRAIDLDPDLFAPHYNLGNVMEQRGKWADAETAFRTAVGLDETHANARVGLGHVLFKRWKFADAEGELREALALEPDHPEAHLYLSYVLNQTGRYQEAWAELIRARELGAHFHAAYAAELEARVKGR